MHGLARGIRPSCPGAQAVRRRVGLGAVQALDFLGQGRDAHALAFALGSLLRGRGASLDQFHGLVEEDFVVPAAALAVVVRG